MSSSYLLSKCDIVTTIVALNVGGSTMVAPANPQRVWINILPSTGSQMYFAHKEIPTGFGANYFWSGNSPGLRFTCPIDGIIPKLEFHAYSGGPSHCIVTEIIEI